MLDDILQALHEVQGVQATLLIDGGGRILAYRAHPVYDIGLLQVVGRGIVSAVDSVQVVHDDWELVTASYSEGKVLIRNLRPGGRQAQNVLLAIIADTQLNRSFAGVAIRVAAGKLKAELEAPAGSPPRQTGGIPAMSGTTGPLPRQTGGIPTIHSTTGLGGARQAAPHGDLTGSGLSWSLSSSAGASGVSVVDAVASAFLSTCTKALSSSVGPMAKVFVKEAVRKICPDRPFARGDGAALLEELERRIDDSDERKLFHKMVTSA